jgi:hypothetical protein
MQPVHFRIQLRYGLAVSTHDDSGHQSSTVSLTAPFRHGLVYTWRTFYEDSSQNAECFYWIIFLSYYLTLKMEGCVAPKRPALSALHGVTAHYNHRRGDTNSTNPCTYFSVTWFRDFTQIRPCCSRAAFLPSHHLKFTIYSFPFLPISP